MSLFVGMVLLLSSSTGVEGASRETKEEKSRLIIAFGDSLTAGYGVSLEEAYPALLEKRLEEYHFSYRVLNAGISGETTSGGLARINQLLKQAPGIVILELGANDGLRGIALELIESNLSQMIEILQKKRVKVLLAGMKLPPNYGKKYTEGFQQIYPNLAKKYQVNLIPFFLEGIAAKEALNQGDGLHPTAEGYRIVLENVWPALKPLLH